MDSNPILFFAVLFAFIIAAFATIILAYGALAFVVVKAIKLALGG